MNEKIAYLYEPTHPAIIRFIHQVVENAHKENITVSMCGEMGSNPSLAVLIVGLGVDEISTSPFLVPKIKKTILSIDLKKAREIAHECLKISTGEEVKHYLDDEIRRYFPGIVEMSEG